MVLAAASIVRLDMCEANRYICVASSCFQMSFGSSQSTVDGAESWLLRPKATVLSSQHPTIMAELR